MSLLIKITFLPFSSLCSKRAAFKMRWSALSSLKTLLASSWLVPPVSITTLKLPLPFPLMGFQWWSIWFLASLSISRMNSRASKFLVSLPFLKLSSSSSTVMGMPTSCSSKLRMLLCSKMMTEVSSTKIFLSFSFLFLDIGEDTSLTVILKPCKCKRFFASFLLSPKANKTKMKNERGRVIFLSTSRVYCNYFRWQQQN